MKRLWNIYIFVLVFIIDVNVFLLYLLTYLQDCRVLCMSLSDLLSIIVGDKVEKIIQVIQAICLLKWGCRLVHSNIVLASEILFVLKQLGFLLKIISMIASHWQEDLCNIQQLFFVTSCQYSKQSFVPFYIFFIVFVIWNLHAHPGSICIFSFLSAFFKLIFLVCFFCSTFSCFHPLSSILQILVSIPPFHMHDLLDQSEGHPLSVVVIWLGLSSLT